MSIMHVFKGLLSEPVTIGGLVDAVVSLVGAFGVHLSADQVAAIGSVTAIVVAAVARQLVIPLYPPPPRPPS